MSTNETAIDRSGWPKGPWDIEPDREQWQTSVGFVGIIVRNRLGALCGYVGVPEGHQAHGRSWESSDSYERGEDGEIDYDRRKPNPVDDLNVHGGITYAEPCQGNVCHVPAPGELEHLWWLGFDCSHSGDASPGMMKHGLHLGHFGGSIYRDMGYVRREVERLAQQLADMAMGAK